jgi:UPF0755 protein
MTDLSVWTDDHRPARNHRKRRKRKDRKGPLAVLIAVVIVVALIVVAAMLVRTVGSKLKDTFSSNSAADYSGAGTGKAQIEVKSGQTVAEIGRTLEQADVIKSVQAFLLVANADPDSSSVQPGFYAMHLKMSAGRALETLLDPSARVQARVTVREGLRIDKLVPLLADKTGIMAADFRAALKDPSQLGLPDYAKNGAEGFLFPATYDVAPGSSAVSVLRQMVTRFKQAAADVGLDDSDLSPYELVTLASLLEVEARKSSDYGKVSRVVRNRIAKGMHLQFDSTIHYAFRDDKRKLSIADTRVRSPYNTYVNAGLPIGPIDSPGEATLKAAANPTPGPWIYFVTTNLQTGLTKFTDKYSEFLQFKAELKANNP